MGYLHGGCCEDEEITAADAASVRESKDVIEYFILIFSVGIYQWHENEKESKVRESLSI